MMKFALAMTAMFAQGANAQDSCADPLSQDTMIQVRRDDPPRSAPSGF
jgi:hypothetical protein